MKGIAKVLLLVMAFAYLFAIATPVVAATVVSPVVAGDCSGGNCPLPPDGGNDGGCDGGSCDLPGGGK